MIRHLAPVFALIALTLSPACACSFSRPPIDKVLQEIATEGVMVSGTVIQAFDAVKYQPDIIRGDRIFIGEGGPRDFVLYRPKAEFDRVNIPPPVEPMCILWQARLPVNHSFDRLFLVPAEHHWKDDAANGRWVFVDFYDDYFAEGGLEKVLEAADRAGRLQSLPLPRTRSGNR